MRERKSDLRLPQSQLSVLCVGADQVLMRVMADPYHVLLMNVQGPFKFAGGRGEAVEDKVFADAVDPLPARRDAARYKVTAGPLARRERPKTK